MNFENVTAVKKANVYFDGKVTSRTIIFPDGSKKTLGVMLPGEYEFSTGAAETMEVIGGSMCVQLPRSDEWVTFTEGQAYNVPANSKFKLKISEVADYCCSFAE